MHETHARQYYGLKAFFELLCDELRTTRILAVGVPLSPQSDADVDAQLAAELEGF